MLRKVLLILALTPLGSYATIPINPDVRPDTLAKTVCMSGYTAQVRPSSTYTNGIKRRLLEAKGLPWSEAKTYELDHIIPLSIGGHPRNPQNLMLQPWHGKHGAKKKDRLEVKLQCLVCTGAVPLHQAQEAIFNDWQAAYARYSGLKCKRPLHTRMQWGD